MIAALGALAGAILGSFLATLIIRWPKDRSISTGRSQCDACGRVLGVRDLIPIVSSLVQRSRCRTCGARIDPTHLRVELACALIGGMALLIQPGAGGAALAFLGWLMVPLVVLDWRHFWLPDRLTLLVAAVGLAVGGYATGLALSDRVIGGAAGFLSLWLIGVLFVRFRGKRGLGGGDAKLLGGIGCWVGWQHLPTVLLVAAGGSLVVILALGFHRDRARRYPFGAALGFAGWLVAASLLFAIR